ncbi:MAG TPA: hypothetical protein DCL54_10665 [Alphaproteobacteria bacterium]|nr:hypothetical protein [Alphaproteobacteria bacterium]HAJ47030.1 hypothetical protein [Alphaproteobacteria bacterium]
MGENRRKRARGSRAYTVFVSHAWNDRWVALQIARAIKEAGAESFIDVQDIVYGDRIAARIQQGLKDADEVVALLTPQSISRTWVQHEIGAAVALERFVVGILYNVTPETLQAGGGMGMLAERNCVSINDMDTYLSQLKKRIVAR